jgi:hypothetical protein
MLNRFNFSNRSSTTVRTSETHDLSQQFVVDSPRSRFGLTESKISVLQDSPGISLASSLQQSQRHAGGCREMRNRRLQTLGEVICKGFWVYVASNGRLLKPDFADRPGDGA